MIMQKIPFGLKKIQEAAAMVSEETSSLSESSSEESGLKKLELGDSMEFGHSITSDGSQKEE